MCLRHCMCFATCSLWKDRQHFLLFQYLIGSSHSLTISLTTFHWKCSQEANKPAHLTMKSLFFCHIHNSCEGICRNDRNINPRKMVSRDDIGSTSGYVIATA